MGATHFKMRTLKNVATEMALHVLAYNMTRVMKIMGVPAMIAVASMSQPTPSDGTMISSGAPAAFDLAPRNANEMPIGISPAAANLQGFEPEWV